MARQSVVAADGHSFNRSAVPVTFSQTAAYWTADEGWHTELHVRNNMGDASLVLTPTLHDPSGKPFPLPTITLAPKVGKVLDLSSLITQYAPALLGQYGSLQLEYQAAGFRALYAAVMIHRMAKPIAFHVDTFGSAVKVAEGSREGIWWLPTKNSTDTLIVTNRASEEVNAILRVTGASARKFDLPITLAPLGSTRLSVKSLLADHGITDEYGGVELHALKNAGYLDTVHFVVDEQTHFSALLKMFRYSEQDSMATRRWSNDTAWVTRAPMLALTNPDPELRLPKGAKLHPKLFVRNVTAHPVAIGLSFNWRNDQSHGTGAGPSMTLAPFSTRLIDVSELQVSGVIPQTATWASVALRAGSKPNEVMAIATSFSDEAAYGAQTPFNDQLAFHWAGGMFLVDALHNSLTTVGNGGSKPAKAQFLLWTEQAASSNATPIPYELDQTLQPGEHMWVNIGDLIRRRVPDIHGKVLPANLKTGTYEYLDETNRAHGSLFEGKVITDKTNGHATYGCMECCGYNNADVPPIGLNLGDTSYMPISGQSSCSNGPIDISGYFSDFVSDNTNVLSFPQPYDSLVANGVGSANLNATAFNIEEDLGGADEYSCPTDNLYAYGPANVASLTCTTVTRSQTTTCTATGPGGVTFSNWQFSDGTNTVSSQNGTSATKWTGAAVISGAVTVTATFSDGSSMQASSTLTVNPRNWHTSPALPQEVSNGTFIFLPVPPSSSGPDSGLGYYASSESSGGTSGPSTISDGGPNNGYLYLSQAPEINTTFRYEINPDLENQSSMFSSEQTGSYNIQTNSQGRIGGSDLLTQTRRHEYNDPVQSHFGEWTMAISSKNIGDNFESLVQPPGSTQANFNQAAQQIQTNDFNSYDSAVAVEPFAVNENSLGIFLGNICYPNYTSCPQ